MYHLLRDVVERAVDTLHYPESAVRALLLLLLLAVATLLLDVIITWVCGGCAPCA